MQNYSTPNQVQNNLTPNQVQNHLTPNQVQSYLPGFWSGPAGILVSNMIDRVIEMDEVNYRSRNGGVTEVYTTHRLKYDIYIKKYAQVGVYNLLYYFPQSDTEHLSDDPNNWVRIV